MSVFFGIGCIEYIKRDVKTGVVPQMTFSGLIDKLLRGDSSFYGGEFNRGTMGIIRTDINCLVAQEL